MDINKINFKKWAKDLFPINRSLTGPGVVKTLKYINKISNNKFKIKSFKTGKNVFDWKIPKVWVLKSAYIKDSKGIKICDVKENNLHVVGYSTSIKKTSYFKNIKKNIFTIKSMPNAIPYVTSYYRKFWGFSLQYNKLKKIDKKKKYHFYIDSEFKNGSMNYGEYLIKGKSKKEILLCSYICHPSMANNELSGPLVLSAIAKKIKPSFYSVRIILIPETIGAIAYINKNLKKLKKNLIAGFNLTCVGDTGKFSIIMSKEENTYADKIAKRNFKDAKLYTFLSRGSNERQFGCQNLNLPFVTITRSKFNEFKEYHTSLDNLDFIKEKSLKECTLKVLKMISDIQRSKIYTKTKFCEPFLTKYNLITHLSLKENSRLNIEDIIAYSGINYDEIELSKLLKIDKKNVASVNEILLKNKIIKRYY
jgi:aminopeptidase-like protein